MRLKSIFLSCVAISLYAADDSALFKGQTIVQENNAVKVRDAMSFRLESIFNQKGCFNLIKEEIPEEKVEAKKEIQHFVRRCVKEKKEQELLAKIKEENRCLWDPKLLQVWADGFGDFLRQGSTTFQGTSQIGYHANTGGGAIGIDATFAKFYTLGVMGAYTNSGVHWKNNAAKESIDSAYAGIYFSAASHRFYSNVCAIGAVNHFEGHRNIDNLKAKNSHGGIQVLAHADTGMNLHLGGLTFRPFDSLDYVNQTENSYTETGAGASDLKVNRCNSILIRNELGLELATCLCFGNSKLSISPKVSWVREVRTHGRTYRDTFVGSDSSFLVTGYFPNRNLISPGILLSGALYHDFFHLDLYYNGEFASKYQDNSFGGEFRFGF